MLRNPQPKTLKQINRRILKYFITAIASLIAADIALCVFNSSISLVQSLIALLIPCSLEAIRYLTIWAYERNRQKRISIGLLLITELGKFLLALILLFVCVSPIHTDNKAYPIIYCVSFFAMQGITIYALNKRDK